jgi:hypothetical protein
MDWDIFLRIAAARPAVLINEFLGVSREYEQTKTRSGKMDRAFEIVRMVGKHTQGALTPGSLLYLLDTLLDVTNGWPHETLRGQLYNGLLTLAASFAEKWGGGHSFPEAIDSSDRVYLPFAASGMAGPAQAIDASRLPPVSLVVPNRNQKPQLAWTLQSIRDQDYPDTESVVIDQGSTDGSAELVGHGESGQGSWLADLDLNRATAVNRGLRHARGEVLAWLEPGEQLAAGALRAVGEAFAEDSRLDVLYGNAIHLDGINQMQLVQGGSWRSGFWIGALPQTADPAFSRKGWFPAPRATVFFRRRLLERLGGLNEALADQSCEYDFLERLTSTGLVRKLEQTLALCPISPRPKVLVCAPFLPRHLSQSGGAPPGRLTTEARACLARLGRESGAGLRDWLAGPPRAIRVRGAARRRA